jgi:O-antigen ligase
MQFIGVDFFWHLRENIALDPEHVIGQQILHRERIAGLAYFNIPLAYQLVALAPLVFSLLFFSKTKSVERFFLGISFTVILLALILSLSRSAILGGLAGMLTVLILSDHRFKEVKLTTFAVLSMSTVLLFEPLKHRIFPLENLFVDRTALYAAALKMISDSPFGIGIGQFNVNAAKYLPELSSYEDAGLILLQTPHNHFLNITVYTGFIGGLLLIGLYYIIFKGLFDLKNKTNENYVRILVIGLTGSYSGYIINSMFHNGGPFLGDIIVWYIIGITMFLFNNQLKHGKENEGG